MYRGLRGQSGTALISVMVAGVIMAMMMMAATSMMDYIGIGQKTMDAKASLGDTKNTLKMILHTRSSCALSGLIDQNLSQMANSANPREIPVSIKFPSGETFLEANKPMGHWIPRKVSLVPPLVLVDPATRLYSVTLKIENEIRGRSLATGDKDVSQLLNVTLDNGFRISECSQIADGAPGTPGNNGPDGADGTGGDPAPASPCGSDGRGMVMYRVARSDGTQERRCCYMTYESDNTTRRRSRGGSFALDCYTDTGCNGPMCRTRSY